MAAVCRKGRRDERTDELIIELGQLENIGLCQKLVSNKTNKALQRH